MIRLKLVMAFINQPPSSTRVLAVGKPTPSIRLDNALVVNDRRAVVEGASTVLLYLVKPPSTNSCHSHEREAGRYGVAHPLVSMIAPLAKTFNVTVEAMPVLAKVVHREAGFRPRHGQRRRVYGAAGGIAEPIGRDESVEKAGAEKVPARRFSTPYPHGPIAGSRCRTGRARRRRWRHRHPRPVRHRLPRQWVRLWVRRAESASRHLLGSCFSTDRCPRPMGSAMPPAAPSTSTAARWPCLGWKPASLWTTLPRLASPRP